MQEDSKSKYWPTELISAYMYGEALFRSPLSDLIQCLNWWKSLTKDSGAQILVVSNKSSTSKLLKTDQTSRIVAIKLFSVRATLNTCLAKVNPKRML
jgi:hypothetical protein